MMLHVLKVEVHHIRFHGRFTSLNNNKLTRLPLRDIISFELVTFPTIEQYLDFMTLISFSIGL